MYTSTVIRTCMSHTHMHTYVHTYVHTYTVQSTQNVCELGPQDMRVHTRDIRVHTPDIRVHTHVLRFKTRRGTRPDVLPPSLK